jgi:hypothetical protein
MANLNFKTDLILGNEGEQSLVEYLTTKGLSFVDSNDDNRYDIKMLKNNKEVTYEVKTDVKCAPLFDTGNIFVEFESRGKASGISVTQAEWFVTYFLYLDELWFIKSDILKNLIKTNDFPKFYNAGDIGSETHGYLIKRKDYKQYFHVCKI